MPGFDDAYGAEMRTLVEDLLRFDTTGGNERPAQEWLRERLADLGFETYSWNADSHALATLPSFPAAEEIDVADRPSVAGVIELGDPDAGQTLVLNGHVDVVPVEGEWTGEPFEPLWDGDRLIARGAADMKSQLGACVFAARWLADTADVDGRIVVESVAGEEEGGIGAAMAALSNPYPFERDAAIVTEPTDMRVVTATEGCLMMRLGIEGRPAHAARRWQGEDVLPRFERVRTAFHVLEGERAARVRHPLYDRFDVPWPVVIGRVEAGTWASNVPGELSAEMRIGVAPGETLDAVEREFRERLGEVVGEKGDNWAQPPRYERFGVQFEPSTVDPGESVVRALQDALVARGRNDDPTGETYGADSRHYLAAGIPTVVFGPGRIEEAHFPDESIRWPDVVEAAETLADTAERFLGG